VHRTAVDDECVVEYRVLVTVSVDVVDTDWPCGAVVVVWV
jgi:hypothetical protein